MADDPQAIAEASAAAMWKNDRASRSLGMALVDVGPGRAALTMTVRSDMLNGHGIVHGGFVFLLADSAFAFACNSYDQKVVASGADVSFLAPAGEGTVLTARAQERHRAGRSGLYDVTVSAGDGTVIAHFRGRSRTIRGTHGAVDRA